MEKYLKKCKSRNVHHALKKYVIKKLKDKHTDMVLLSPLVLLPFAYDNEILSARITVRGGPCIPVLTANTQLLWIHFWIWLFCIVYALGAHRVLPVQSWHKRSRAEVINTDAARMSWISQRHLPSFLILACLRTILHLLQILHLLSAVYVWCERYKQLLYKFSPLIT